MSFILVISESVKLYFIFFDIVGICISSISSASSGGYIAPSNDVLNSDISFFAVVEFLNHSSNDNASSSVFFSILSLYFLYYDFNFVCKSFGNLVNSSELVNPIVGLSTTSLGFKSIFLVVSAIV